MEAMMHCLDEQVAEEADDQQSGHDVHRHVVGLCFRHSVGDIIFADVVSSTGPKMPAIDQAVSSNP